MFLVYSFCVQNDMLLASENWPLTKPKLKSLQCNDGAMIRQICNIKPDDVATIMSRSMSLRTSTLFGQRECFTGLDRWSILVMQSEQHVIYNIIEGVGQGGPR